MRKVDNGEKKKRKRKQAGAELGQAQLKLELGFTSTKIWGIALMIAKDRCHKHPRGGVYQFGALRAPNADPPPFLADPI